jgi:hypothetical protein
MDAGVGIFAQFIAQTANRNVESSRRMRAIAATGVERKNDVPSYRRGKCGFMFHDHHDLVSSPSIVLGIDAVIPANGSSRICIITQAVSNFAALAGAAVAGAAIVSADVMPKVDE